jgi:hypothetical protein
MKKIIILFTGLVISLGQQAYTDVEVSVSGLIEVGYEKVGDEKGNLRAGDIEIGIEAKLNKQVSGAVLLRPDAEAKANGDILDEATITLEDFNEAPISITAGKTVMPFGVFNSHLISDPWTKEAAIGTEGDTISWEINQVGVIGSYAKEPVKISLGLYDSTIDEEPTAFAAQVSLVAAEKLTIGGSYRNQKGEGRGTNTLADISAMAQYATDPITVEIEYCKAVTREENKPKPSAYSVGLAFQATDKPIELALRYDGLNDDNENTISSKSRIGIGFNYTLFDAATLSAEVGSTKPEEGKSKTDYAAKLAIEF